MASVAYSSLHEADLNEHSLQGVAINTVESFVNNPPTTTPSRHNSTSPANRSRSFSISDILSDDVGSRKRPSTTIITDARTKQPKADYEMMSPADSAKTFSPRPLLSPVNMYSALHQQIKGMGDWIATDRGHSLPNPQVYPVNYPTSAHLMSSPVSAPPPFSPSYQPLGPAYSPHMAAAAAHMQQYLQMVQQQRNIMAVAVARQQLQQCHDQAPPMSHDQMGGAPQLKPNQDLNRSDNSENSMEENTLHHQMSTPILLKNKRKVMKPSHAHQTTPTNTTSTPEGLHYNIPPHYSRSPLKPPNTTFSPSIFLTRPNSASMCHTPSSPETTDNDREGMSSSVFMTSTPIRRGESSSFLSPYTHSPISSLQHHSDYQSAVAGSDSEVPLLRRPRVPRKRTKPHPTPTHVSSTEGVVVPMSSRHTPSHAPPSSLLTSYTAAMGNMIHHNYSINDSGFASDTTTCSNSHRLQQENIPCHAHTIKPHPSNVSSENIYKTPVKNIYSRGQGGKYPDAWGSSPFTDHLKKTGRIQSVPPWFVCSDKRKDGKRLRLTEAINKSLMETPTQSNNQLPAEWQKYAYGQTEDQKDLTQKARSFLRCRPRVLQFEKAVH